MASRPPPSTRAPSGRRSAAGRLLLLPLAALLALGAAPPPTEVARLLAADGSAVPGLAAVSGRTLVVASGGIGHVFVEPESGWAGDVVAVATLRASDGVLLHAPAIAGELAVLGDSFQRDRTGAAYVFEMPAGGWGGELSESAKLVASDAAPWTLFGSDVAASGDTVAVGAPDAPSGPDSHGAAYVFVRPRRGWAGVLREAAKLQPRAPQRTDFEDGSFFQGLAMAGGAVFAAANYEGAHHGAVYVFERPAEGWGGELFEEARLTASDSRREDHFGQTIAALGDTLVAGSTGYERAGGSPAYVFTEPPGGWANAAHEDARLVATEGAFLSEVAIARGRILASDPLNALYAFAEPSFGWAGELAESAVLRSPRIGWLPAAASGDFAVIGGGVFELGLDADRDGLADGLEARVGSDPFDEDSDRDGILDGDDPSWLAEHVDALPQRVLRSPGSRRAMLRALAKAEERIAAGERRRAVATLGLLHRHLDGCEPAPDPNDWIVECAAQRAARIRLAILAENLRR